ncbi:hypothetical protein J4427_00255 [Candidatus Woesearchaeota archaeon]|nr:hypothetical protein [Candidatus Woesearchaeota archaeon]
MEALPRSEIPKLGRELLESLKKTTISNLNALYTNGKYFYKSYKGGKSYTTNKEGFLSASKILLNKTLSLANGVSKTKISSQINSIYSILLRQGQQLGALQQDKISLEEVEAHMEAYNDLLELMKILIDNARL